MSRPFKYNAGTNLSIAVTVFIFSFTAMDDKKIALFFTMPGLLFSLGWYLYKKTHQKKVIDNY